MKRVECVLCLVCLASAGGQELLKKGAAAYNGGDYAAAVEYFQQAVKADPQSLLAREHLANARAKEFRATRSGDQAARSAWNDVLARDPKNALALWGLAVLDLEGGKLEEAAVWSAKLAEADPHNKNAYYLLGVVRWIETYKQLPEARLNSTVRAIALSKVTEGERALDKALAIDPAFVDALLYQNLLFRTQAQLAGTAEESQKLLAQADALIRKAVDVTGIQYVAFDLGLRIDRGAAARLTEQYHLAETHPWTQGRNALMTAVLEGNQDTDFAGFNEEYAPIPFLTAQEYPLTLGKFLRTCYRFDLIE